MSSPSPSPSPPYRRKRCGDADKPSMDRLSRCLRRRFRLRPRPYSPARRAASMSAPPSPVHVSQNWHSWSPPPLDASVVGRGLHAPPQHQQQERSESGSELDSVSRNWHSLLPPPLDASVVGRGLRAPPQPQQQERSESDSELDSPPHITFLKPEDQEPLSPQSPSGLPPSVHVKVDVDPAGYSQEPRSPTSPPGSPPSLHVKIDVNPAGSPKDSLNDEEDPYFNSLVDNFINATADRCNATYSDDDIDLAEVQRRSVLYAESALKHYNNDGKNKIKYELISGIMSCDMLDEKGVFSHVNFTARGNHQNSEELFFAELRRDGDNHVITCVVSLEGIIKVGGLCNTRYDNKYYLEGMPIDAKHCYCCDWRLKHPKNGELYVMGHVAVSDYYHG